MDEKQVPRTWIDQDILLARSGATTSELTVLKDVSEVGLVYVYKSGEVEGQPIFVPWTAVSWMRPAIPEDAEGSSGNES